MSLFKIKQLDRNREQIVYETRNSKGERIFYGLVKTWPKKVEFYRLSQPFKHYGETIYEPECLARPNSIIKIEAPKGDSEIEMLARAYILLERYMEEEVS